MLLLPTSRHNERTTFQFACAGFFLGIFLMLALVRLLDLSFSGLPEEFWTSFWSAQPGWLSALICLASMLLMILLQAVHSRGAWIIGGFFLFQGFIFSFCTCAMCGGFPEKGVYLALYSTVVPAFFLIFSQLLCLTREGSGRWRLAGCVLGSVGCFAVRCWGVAAAGSIYFG